ncbi:hypothetical protein [Microcoleus sp. Pol17C6]
MAFTTVNKGLSVLSAIGNQGDFILREIIVLTLVVPRMPIRPIHDLLGIW